MDCPNITTLEQAMANLPSSVLPITGLRHDVEGYLTDDAIQIIIDGLKSRGINLTDKTQKKTVLMALMTLLCSNKKQYDFLIDDLNKRMNANETIDRQYLDTILLKNRTLLDILTVARHIDSIQTMNGVEPFIEGWQNMLPPSGEMNPMPPAAVKMIEQFQAERQMLESKDYQELRKHRLALLQEKNRVASNNLGLYGFMNLVAVGLLIYIAAAGSS